MIIPSFGKILQARYILCLFFSSASFFLLLVLMPLQEKFPIELTAVFLYSIGFITPLSFSSILFVTNKIDLFGSHYKMLTNPPSSQSFIMLLVYLFSIASGTGLFFLFSIRVATYFMLIAGITSILLSRLWFNYLYRCFYPNKYEKMEIFRIT
jgi:hypothetical protein